MLTNDARNYNAYFAQFWRLKPNLSIMDGGIGAWELAIRASSLDLNDADINGGEAASYTVGLNWYMTAFTKSMINIIRTESSAGRLYQRRARDSPGPAPGGTPLAGPKTARLSPHDWRGNRTTPSRPCLGSRDASLESTPQINHGGC